MGSIHDQPLTWLRVNNDADLTRIPKFLKNRGVNVYNPKSDKNGNPIMLLGYDAKPDSDWGKFKGNSAAIWFANAELAAAATPLVEHGLGWTK